MSDPQNPKITKNLIFSKFYKTVSFKNLPREKSKTSRFVAKSKNHVWENEENFADLSVWQNTLLVKP